MRRKKAAVRVNRRFFQLDLLALIGDRNVTISARVQSALGLNVVAEVPFVMPFSIAQATAFA